MTAAKKKFVPQRKDIRIYDAGGDITKRWFIEWKNKDLKPVRSYKGINQYQSEELRRDAIERLIHEVTHPDPDDGYPTLMKRIREFVRARRLHVSKKTICGYEGKAEKFAAWYGGQHMDTTEANLYLDWLVEIEGVHPSTRNHYRVFMSMAWKWMIGRGYYTHNPWQRTAKIRAVKTPARPFSLSQVAHLKRIMTLKHPDLWLFCLFQYYTFIRPKELRLMMVSDILWEERRLLVRSEISKNKKEEYVVIPNPFYPVLQEFFWGRDPSYFLFTPEGGAGRTPIGINTMSTRHRRLLKDLKYSNAHKLYSWKHTGAKQAAMNGISVKELQLQLRHHSLDQVDQYLKGLGVQDLYSLAEQFPAI